LFDLFRCEDIDELEDANEYNKLAVRDAMTDIFAYCYLNTYSPRSRNLSGDFSDSVLSHLLTYTLAHGFDLHGLVELVERCFRAAFAFYCANAEESRVIAALKKCFSPKFTRRPAPALQLLHETALRAFETRLAMHKRNGQFREALALMEAVPLATAEVYSRPLDGEGELQDGEDSDESADADQNEEDDDIADGVCAGGGVKEESLAE
jgi:hypothetical protein